MPIELAVLAWDPGPTTGVCRIEQYVGEPTFRVVLSAIVPWNQRFQISQQLISTDLNAEIVCENFLLYKAKAKKLMGNDFPSSQMIGTLGAWAWLYGQRTIHLYPASIMSRVEILPEHVDLLHNSEHGRDAYKHARNHMVKTLRKLRGSNGR